MSTSTSTRLKVFEYRCATYEQYVSVAVGTEKQFHNYMQATYGMNIADDYELADMGSLCVFCDRALPGSPIVIWLRSFDPLDADDVAILTHECYHAVIAMLRGCGVYEQASDENNEIVAYPLRDIVRGLLGQLIVHAKRSHSRSCRHK